MGGMILVLPKSFVNLEDYRHLPLYFLAGPILGADDYRRPLADMLVEAVGDCIIVTPCRYDSDPPPYQFRMPGDENFFPRQRAYERPSLPQAAEVWPAGGIIFWLAAQRFERKDGNPYAMDSRDEIAEWRGRKMWNREARIVVGGEPDFPGLEGIDYCNKDALGRDFPMHKSLEALVEHAAKYAKQRPLP